MGRRTRRFIQSMQQINDKATLEQPETTPAAPVPLRLLGGIRLAAEGVLIGGVRFYQLAIRPFLPPSCRFHPSCSEYFIEAVRKYGPISGACRGTWRICRCHPWNEGGYDPP